MDSDDSENICPSFSDDQDDCDLSATDAYRQAISKVGQSACRAGQAKVWWLSLVRIDQPICQKRNFFNNQGTFFIFNGHWGKSQALTAGCNVLANIMEDRFSFIYIYSHVHVYNEEKYF